jgi:hypothetical protein
MAYYHHVCTPENMNFICRGTRMHPSAECSSSATTEVPPPYKPKYGRPTECKYFVSSYVRTSLSNVTLVSFQKIRKKICNIYYGVYVVWICQVSPIFLKVYDLQNKDKWYGNSYEILFTLIFFSQAKYGHILERNLYVRKTQYFPCPWFYFMFLKKSKVWHLIIRCGCNWLRNIRTRYVRHVHYVVF